MEFGTALNVCSFLPGQLTKAYNILYLVFSKILMLILTMDPRYEQLSRSLPFAESKPIVPLNHPQNLTFDLECAHIAENCHLQLMVFLNTGKTPSTAYDPHIYGFLTFIFIWSGYGVLFLTSFIFL